MSNRALQITTAMAAGLGFTLSAGAAITYVDAVEGAGGNTGQTGQPLSDESWYVLDQSSGNDTTWGKRTGIGTDGTIFQAAGVTGSTEAPNVPELYTQVTGLDAGAYTMWAFFQDQVTNSTQNWVLSAGLTSGNLTTYSASDQPAVPGATASGIDAGTLSFTNTPLVSEGGVRTLYGVNLGQAVVTGPSDVINVYLDMNIPGSTSTQRVFYDGVGYELVPEPGSLALLGLGGLLLARRRRD